MTILIIYSSLRTEFRGPTMGQVFAPVLRRLAFWTCILCTEENGHILTYHLLVDGEHAAFSGWSSHL